MIDVRICPRCLLIALLFITAAVGAQAKRVTEQPRDIDCDLIRAVSARDSDQIRCLLDQGADPNARYQFSWLEIDVTRTGSVPVLALALGWNRGFWSFGCLMELTQRKRKKIDIDLATVSALIDAGAQTNAEPEFDPLMFACTHCSAQTVERLLLCRRPGGMLSPDLLPCACDSLQSATFGVLLQLGAAVNASDRTHGTPLIALAKRELASPEDTNEQLSIGTVLIKEGALVDARDSH